MKKIFLSVLQAVFSSLVLLVFLEGIFIFAGMPKGASRFIEKIVISENLSAKKPKDEFRIFTYGESTMHGSHYAPASNPARWLQAYVRDFLPEKNVRVVNFARMGQESDFVYRAFRDTLAYQPGVCFFYFGHNQFLPGNLARTVREEQSSPAFFFRRFVRQSRFMSAIYRGSIARRVRKKKEKADDSMEYKDIEVSPFGRPETRAYLGTPDYEENIIFFRQNVLKILRLAKEKNVPVLFFKPVCNLKDFAPTASLHMKSLSAEALARWDSFYEQGKTAQQKGDFETAEKFYEKAYEIDGTFAELAFRLGEVHFKNGGLEKAKKLFEEARDHDAQMVRVNKDILNVFFDLEKTEGLPLIDTEKLFSPEAPGGIMGEPIIEDNVHPSLKGHAILGRKMAEELAGGNWIAPRSQWRFERERPYEEMAKELGIDRELLFTANLKMVYYFGPRLENRVRFARRALAIRPKDPRALRHLAWSYWLMNHKDKALQIYGDLKLSDPDALQKVFQNQPDIKNNFYKKFHPAS